MLARCKVNELPDTIFINLKVTKLQINFNSLRIYISEVSK